MAQESRELDRLSQLRREQQQRSGNASMNFVVIDVEKQKRLVKFDRHMRKIHDVCVCVCHPAASLTFSQPTTT
jgi:hypothetical protein